MDSVSVKFIVDTGCPITIINEQTFKHIGATFIDTPVQHSVKTANGNQAKVLGYAKIKLQIKNYIIPSQVVVVNGIVKDCLLGMDMLESCPLTVKIIAQLRFLLESKSSRPKQEKRLNKLIIDFDNMITSSNEWRMVSESPTREFFEGILDAEDTLENESKLETSPNSNNNLNSNQPSNLDQPLSLNQHLNNQQSNFNIDQPLNLNQHLNNQQSNCNIDQPLNMNQPSNLNQPLNMNHQLNLTSSKHSNDKATQTSKPSKTRNVKTELAMALQKLVDKMEGNESTSSENDVEQPPKHRKEAFIGEHSKNEEEMDILANEFSVLCNWFMVNEITVEDLDDKEDFKPQIRLDMEVEQMREEILKYIEPICSTGFSSLRTAPGVK